MDTEQASLEEVIEDGEIDEERKLLPSQLESKKALYDGVTFPDSDSEKNFDIQEKMPGKLDADLSQRFSLNIDSTFRVKQEEAFCSVRVKGSVTLTPGLRFKMKIKKFKLKEFLLAQHTAEVIKLKTTFSAGMRLDEKVQLASFNFNPITFWVGPVPVVIVPQINVYVGITGEISANLEFGFEHRGSYRIGIQLADGKWSKIREHSDKWSFDEPEGYFGAAIKPYAGVEFVILLYGVAGPNLKGQAYVLLEVTQPFSLDEPPSWNLYCGIEALAGISIEIISIDIFEQSWRILDWRIWLAGSDGDPDIIESDTEHDPIPGEGSPEFVPVKIGDF